MPNEYDERRTTMTAETTLIQRVEALEREMAQLKRVFSGNIPREHSKSEGKEAVVVANIAKIGIQDSVIFCFRIKGPQTKEQAKKILDVWGVAYGSWFDGGNFNNRLLKNRIVKSDGELENGERIYSLTMKGEQIADEKISRLDQK